VESQVPGIFVFAGFKAEPPSRKYLIAQEVNLRGRMATEFLSNEDTVKLETAYVEVLKKLGQPQ
jgi:hypothetical protein